MNAGNGRKPKQNRGSSSAAKYSTPFFTYRLKDMGVNDKEIGYNPKAYEIGKIAPNVEKQNKK